MWSESIPSPARAPRPRLRRHGSGYAVTAPGLFVWEESRREAEEWEREVAGPAAKPRRATPGRSQPVDPTGETPRRPATNQPHPRAP